jgi:hypothetical protein
MRKKREKKVARVVELSRSDFYRAARGLAIQWADGLETRGILGESQKWEGFEKARKAWVAALASKWMKWKVRRLDVPEGDDAARRLDYFLLQEVFLMRLRRGKEDDAELFRQHALLFGEAALLGDTDFFQSLAKVLTGKRDRRDLQGQILSCWMSAGLWSASWDAASYFITRKCGLPVDSPENIRALCQKLKLYHSPKPMILNWKKDLSPVYRRNA